MKHLLLALLLLSGTMVKGQDNLSRIGKGITTTDSLPRGISMADLIYPERNPPPPDRFLGTDTISGYVEYYVKAGRVFSSAVRIDSLFEHFYWEPPHYTGFTAEYLSPTIERSEIRRLKSITTLSGKVIDTKKRYEFIPQSEIQ